MNFMTARSSITLREVRSDDDQFLLDVYESTRADEMALLPWTDEQRKEFLRFQFTAQNSYYRKEFPEASYSLILNNEKRVGRIYVLRREAIRILDITLLPKHRGQGIGTLLLRELLSEAKTSGKTVQTYVETFNRSLSLFERLGFSKVGEDGVNFLLQWSPPD